jgi:hypothetical protein
LARALSGQRRLTDLPEAATRATPPGHYRLTPAQREELAELRCKLDPAGDLAWRLARRGFSLAEVLQACRDVRRFAGGDGRALETIAAFRRAGLDRARYRDLQRSGRTLTDWYNRQRFGGPGLAIAGWILTGIGGHFLTMAVLTWAIYGIYTVHRARRTSDCGGEEGDGDWVGLAVTSVITAALGVISTRTRGGSCSRPARRSSTTSRGARSAITNAGAGPTGSTAWRG